MFLFSEFLAALQASKVWHRVTKPGSLVLNYNLYFAHIKTSILANQNNSPLSSID